MFNLYESNRKEDKEEKRRQEEIGMRDRSWQKMKAHYGPVWKLAWAHPEFGQILASCSFDKTVVIWEEAEGMEAKVKEKQQRKKLNEINTNVG